MLNLGLINFDNTGLVPNTVPKVTATAGTQTLSPSLLTDDGTTLKYNGVAINTSGAGVTGSGTTGRIPKLTAASVIGNSAIDDGVTTAGVVTSTEPVAAPSLRATVVYSAGTPLPVAPPTGTRTVVSDATTPTFLGAYVSGGAVVAPVIYTGAGWVTA